ncbi:MAG: hypothetical protein H0T79_05455 [Deltaproteobacteria bacterium]|nr:hypothetical protein [Deltaproteobacteria bacterium]
MSNRRSIHDRLFRAIVVMGASLGTTACEDARPTPDARPVLADASVTDAATDAPLTDALTDATEVDAVIIL